MLLELPENISLFPSEILFPTEKPIGIISPAKNGILVYGINGNLIGQSFLIDKNPMRVSIGDGGSVDVKKEGQAVTVCPSPLEDALKRNGTNFFVFGDPNVFQYKLYIKKPGVVEPVEAAVVAKHLYNPTVFYKINESAENIVRILLILLSINQI